MIKENAQKETFARENMCAMQASFCLAQKMGTRLGRGKVL